MMGCWSDVRLAAKFVIMWLPGLFVLDDGRL